MFSVWTLAAVVLGYMLLLFVIAFVGDRHLGQNKPHPTIYSLAMGVHCTSWAFFGTTTQASQYGWAFIPTYLGIILVMMFGFNVLQRIVQLCQRNNISSLADFIGLQYQKSHLLAAMVTVLCFFGVVPYIALQLDAVSRGLEIVGLSADQGPDNIGMYVTLLMALFAILFGTRSFSLTDKHPGLMLTVAFESIVKLVALVAIGLFVCYGMFNGMLDLFGQAYQSPNAQQIVNSDGAWGIYASHVLLGICAMFCLPRQFHINFIESNGSGELQRARWLFPLYLVAISVFVLPIALAGHITFPAGSISTDSYVLALPVAAQQPLLTLVGFIGGLAAATSMVIVATLAVGIMISNNLVTPLWLQFQLRGGKQDSLNPSRVLLIRRLTVLLVLGIAYLYHTDVSQGVPLVKSGIISIALLSQTLPIMILGMYWSRGHRIAAQWALVAGAAYWCYGLLWPSIKSSYYFDPPPSDSALGVAFVISLAVNVSCFVCLSLLLTRKATASDDEPAALRSHVHQAIKLTNLHPLCDRVLTGLSRQRVFAAWPEQQTDDYASPGLLARIEDELTAQVGRASARILLSAVAEKQKVALPELVDWVEEASQTFQFNLEVLQSSVEHIEQGISVVDRDLRLLAWNQRYIEMFSYPEGFIKVGLTIRELLIFNARRGMLGNVSDLDEEIDKRIRYMQTGSRYKYLRTQQDGRVIELNGSPLPGGGFVTTYSDITEYIAIQRQLEESKSQLEARVTERTEALQVANQALAEAKREADTANESKTRFLAAAGHDLMQPFNAASLFASLLVQQADSEQIKHLSQNVMQSLDNAEELLSMLLDMTRLESGALTSHPEKLPLDAILSPLVEEFTLMANQKGLTLKYVKTSAWVFSDKKLLRRVVQNLISNAIRYTNTGTVLIGVRRSNNQLRLDVLDTGPGIAEEDQTAIFQEFNQLDDTIGKSGLGLGLTIVERITALLEHPLNLHSQVNKGTCFSLTLPRCSAPPQQSRPSASNADARDTSQWLADKHILIVENELHTRDAISQLLESWGARVSLASDYVQLEAVDQAPDLMLLDYHLNNQQTGIDAAAKVRERFGQTIVGILNSADRSESVRQAASQAHLHYLPKPLKPAAFKKLVKQLNLKSTTPV